MKKKDLVNHIENLKGKVTVDATIQKLYYEISQLYIAQKMKFSIKDFFSKCDQIHSFRSVSTSVNNLMT